MVMSITPQMVMDSQHENTRGSLQQACLRSEAGPTLHGKETCIIQAAACLRPVKTSLERHPIALFSVSLGPAQQEGACAAEVFPVAAKASRVDPRPYRL
jgi:hypothetical protein